MATLRRKEYPQNSGFKQAKMSKNIAFHLKRKGKNKCKVRLLNFLAKMYFWKCYKTFEYL